jgi:hypothetical protein
MSALNSLEQEAKDENQIMQELAVKSSQDSDSIRILTIITLIYLPCTVVSVSDISQRFPIAADSLCRASTLRSL